ncbi:hypothetical protein [Streptomyces griseoluteus]
MFWKVFEPKVCRCRVKNALDLQKAGREPSSRSPKNDLVRASLGLRYATIGPFQSGTLGGGPAGMRHLVTHVGSQMTFDIGKPDPARMDEVLAAVESAYGTGEAAYERLVALRDGRTRTALGPLGWPQPPALPDPQE